MNKITLPVLLSLLGLTLGGITKDHNITHGHSKQYFDNIRNKNAADHLYVHLIPHTHDDVGWLKNPDQYFSGTAMNTLQYAYVEIIIDSMIEQLLADPVKKFTYVEMKFFSMWWAEQTDDLKSQVRMLVQQGRLEIVNGGWTMNDEACPHYEDILNNMMIGHKFLEEEFGITPKIGWHLDPFGHSNGNPRLFAEMGFDAWFFARLDYQDKEKRLEEKTMEYVLRPFYDSLGSRSQIFTHALYHHYSAPDGFCFDVRCNDDPIEDDPKLETFNLDKKLQDFRDWVLHQSEHYVSNHLFVTMGDDFNFMNAKMYFTSMDRLISNFNKKWSDITLIYSTPSDYISAIASQDITWPTKYDDMFPYADNENSFWTGYFSSRPNDKEYIRRGQHNLMASNKLYALKMIEQSTDSDTAKLMLEASYATFDAMGINQHHDAVTGTGKQAVANDYAWRIFKGMEKSNKEYQAIIEQAAQRSAGLESNSDWMWCYRENSTYLDCPIAAYENAQVNFIVAVHNPSTLPLKYSKIQLPHGNFQVQGFNYNTLNFESAKGVALCENVNIESGSTVENCDLFVEHQVEPFETAFISLVYDPKVDLKAKKVSARPKVDIVKIESDSEVIQFVDSIEGIGELFTLQKKNTQQQYSFSFDIRYWPSFYNPDQQSSGDYIFRPKDNTYDSLKFTTLKSISYHVSDFVQQIEMVYEDETLQTSAQVFVRLFKDAAFSEWFVSLGSVPKLQEGTEVTVNFYSLDIDNANTFYTDSNGLEMQKRVLNYRPTWDWSGSQNISGNYYPIQSAIAIRDEAQKLQMTVMNSRSQGGSVIKNGRIELMQHRRLFHDDWRGMGEAVDEQDSMGNPILVPAQYFLQIFNYEDEPSLQREIQLRQDDPAQYFFQFNAEQSKKAIHYSRFASPAQNLESFIENKGVQDKLKINMFPKNLNLIQVRLENIGDIFDDFEQSSTVMTVDIIGLATSLYEAVNGESDSLASVNIKEKAITGNQDYEAMWAKKIQWKTADDSIGDRITYQLESNYKIGLEKQRIRVFEIEYVPKVNQKDIIIQ